MLKKKEVWQVLFAILIMSLVIYFSRFKYPAGISEAIDLLKITGFSALLIIAAVFAKKFAARRFDIEIEHSIWKIKRYGFYQRSYFSKPIPAGFLLPVILMLFSSGYIKFFSLLQFDAVALKSKIVKKHGNPNVRTSEINESELGIIVFYGIITVLALAMALDIAGLNNLARYSVYYAIANLIPLGNLDGMKLLMSAGEPVHGSGKPGSTKLFAPLFFFAWVLAVIALIIVL